MNISRIQTVFAVLVLTCTSSFSKELYVATNGNDSNPGTFSQPYKTFDKATSQIYAGDTLYIREGRYSQELKFKRGGEPGNPIVVLAYPGEKVVITALEPLSGWELDEGSVYKTNVGWNLEQENFVMYGDTACDLARWPNNDDGKPFTLNSLRNTGGSTSGVEYDAYLDYSPGIPDYDWSKGGSVFFYCDKAGWLAWKSFVKSNTSTRLYFDLDKSASWIRTAHPPADLGDFFLEGIREVLDYQNEWFFDEGNGVLYIQLPGGIQPADSVVYMRKRVNTISLNMDYLVVKNIDVFGGSIKITGNYNNLHGVRSRWGNHHRGIMKGFATGTQSLLFEGSHNTVSKCEFGYGAGSGVYIKGDNNKVVNCYIHNFNFLGSYDAPVNMRGGTRTLLSRNTIFNGGRDCIQYFNKNSEVSYNDVFKSNLIADDCGLIYTVGGPFNSTIHHNWFHDTWSRRDNYKAAGIYLDNDATAFTVNHNVVWNTEWTSIQMNLDVRDIDIYNNTLLEGSKAMGAWHKDGTHFERVVVYNNLADNDGWEEQADKKNNLTIYTDPFVNKAAKNFQLKSGTEPVDYGMVIPGYTDGYLGSSPDAGAYELGQPMWKAGIDWDPVLGPDVCTESDVYEEVNGIVIVEAESASSLGEGWTVSDSLPSFGSAYLEYTGPDEISGVVDSTISTWKVKISNPGTYRFLWRSRNGTGAAGSDQQNSSWLNIQCDEFLGVAADSTYKLSTSYAEVSVNDTSKWTWENKTQFNSEDIGLFARFNYSGIYTIRIAGRSSGHIIDRFAMLIDGRESFATDSSALESYTGCDSYSTPNQWSSTKQADIWYKDVEFQIDGSMDSAWYNQPSMKCEYSLSDDDPPLESDLSYSFRLSANDSALFLFTYIKDDVLTMEDNLELFINPDNNHLPLGVYGEDAIHIRLNYGSKDSLSIKNGSWKADDYKGFKCITTDATEGYILEARIPWKGIIPFEVDSALGLYMGLEVQVNDYDLDPEIKNILAWANNTGIDFSMYDTRKFGTLAVIREPDPPARATGVNIPQDTIIIQFGQIITLEADVLPENAENKTVTWSTLDASVINLAPSTGVVKGIFYGTTLVIATTQDGGYTDTCVVIVPNPNPATDIEDLEWTDPGRREISLIPNPANRAFRIKGINHWTQMQVYNITGELVLNLPYTGNEDYIDIGHLPAGLFLIRIQTNETVYLKKIIKN